MSRRPWIKDHRTAVVLGVLLFALGAAVLYDAYEGRGMKTPRILRPVTFW